MATPLEVAEVERLVGFLQDAVKTEFGDFRADLGSTSVMVFAQRFLQAMLVLCPDAKREEASARMSEALAHMAEELEYYAVVLSAGSETKH